MIQLVVNVNLLREIDEKKLINTYARLIYLNEEDTSVDFKIRDNLKKLFDWDINGENGLAIYCSKFESLKEKDWIWLINFIKENAYEIRTKSYIYAKEKRLEDIKKVESFLEQKESKQRKRFLDKNYKVSGRGVKARPCIYKGRKYSSRQECIYKENISKYELYIYLKETNQM